RQVIAFDRPIGNAGEDEHHGGSDASAAREHGVAERPEAPSHQALDARRNLNRKGEPGRADQGLSPAGGRPLQRLSAASSTKHRISSPNARPARAASSDTNDSVMPGSVLTSRQTSSPVPPRSNDESLRGPPLDAEVTVGRKHQSSFLLVNIW